MSALKFTSVENTPEMVQAKLSNKLAVDVSLAAVSLIRLCILMFFVVELVAFAADGLTIINTTHFKCRNRQRKLMVSCSLDHSTCLLLSQRLYREKGENLKHNYTLSGELPEHVQAKLNALNISEVKKQTHFQ